MQYIGKRLTWDEAVDIFTDLWVAFKDCRMSGIDLLIIVPHSESQARKIVSVFRRTWNPA